MRGQKGVVESLVNHPPPDGDVYIEDEAELALHPSLTRMWVRRGRERQYKVRAPGVNQKRHLFGATDWQEGIALRCYADHRDSATFCSLAARCVARSQSRGRRAILLVDNLRIHTPEGARNVQDLVAHYGGEWMELVYLPKYSPDLQPQERLWRVWRGKVTHNHQRTALDELEADSEACFAEWDADPMAVLRLIGSPFASIEPKETLHALVILDLVTLLDRMEQPIYLDPE